TGTHFSDTFYTVGGSPLGVAVGDVVGDGKQDVVVDNFNFFTGFRGVTVLYGNGDGTFRKTASFAVPGQTPVSVALGDLRGTGRDDVVVGNNPFGSSSAFTVLLNDGTGTGFTATNYAQDLFGSGTIAIGDLRGTGILDVVTSGSAVGAAGVAV